MGKIIAAYGGGFKPPTKGHLEVVKRALESNPDIDEFIIYVGGGERNGITQAESILIWEIFKKHLPMKVRIEPSKAPIGSIVRLGKNNPQDTVYFVIGGREGRDDDMQDIESRTKNIEEKYPNMKIKVQFTPDEGMSGTNARKAAKISPEKFYPYLPDELSDEEKREVYDIVRPVISERGKFAPDFDEDEVDAIEDFADDKMRPDIDIDLSGQHFFDRLNDPRNYPDIEPYELEDFFEKLSDKKDEFIAFLKKYKEMVAKDTDTNINIPFMKIANKAIAKTIMRKKNFASSTPILPLQEGRYDQEVLTQSRFIINMFKAEFGNEFEEDFEGQLEDIYYDLELKFVPSSYDILGPVPFIINAAGDGDSIEIVIVYVPEAFPEAYNELNAEVKDTLRHELEHVGQFNFDKGVDPSGSQDDLDLFDYLTLDYEIPAFVQGIYKKAKTKKISFSQALQDFLDERLDELTPDEEAKVKKIYTNWAKKNLPAAQIDEKLTIGNKVVKTIHKNDSNNPEDHTIEFEDGTTEPYLQHLNEGRYDSISRQLASIALNAWKGDFKDGASYGYFVGKITPEEYPTDLTFTFKALGRFVDGEYTHNGYSKSDGEVGVKYEIPKDAIPQIWEEVYMDLISTIRHEIEHQTQGGKNVKPGKGMDSDQKLRQLIKKGGSDIVRYVTLPKEIESNVQGLYLKAKKWRRPYDEIVDEYIKDFLKITNPADVSYVKNKWQEVAKKRSLPSLLKENASYSKDINIIEKCAQLTQHMIDKGYNIEPLPSVEFIDGDTENARDFFGKTAYYDPNEKKIVLYTEGRHPKDIVRSYAHEMIHHMQNLEDRLGNIQTTNTQEDDHLNNIEAEANLKGTMTFRNWTDSLEEKKNKDPFGLNAYALELARGLEEALRVKEEDVSSPKTNYMIYSDMDGVITDFDTAFMNISDGIRPSEYEKNMGKDKFWELIDGKGVGYWVGMPWMSDGKSYWDYIKKYNPVLLSSPSRSNTSRLGKRLWVRNNLPGTKLILSQAKDKQNYARKNAILIDDRKSNIEEWRSKGGIGILHISAEDTIRQLKELGL